MTAPRPASASASPSTAAGSGRRRWLVIAAIAVVGALLVAGWMGFSYLFLREAPPAAVGLSSASPTAPAASIPAESAEATDAPAASDPAASDGGAATASGLDGTWTVDPTVGSFADFSSSFVGYRVEEELANIGAATAVGRTPDVTGSVTFAGTTVSAVDMTADLSTLRSDSPQRDGQLRRQALETGTFPTATFTLTEPIVLGAIPADGEAVSATAIGDLTLHGETRSVQIPIQAVLSGDVVTVTGSVEIVFADYGISQPNSFMVLSIDDRGIMELQLQLKRGT